MNILVIGNGAREHCIIWKLRQYEKVDKIFCTLGNAGINKIAIPIDIKPSDIDSLLKFVESNAISFSIVGPEIPLSLGIVDKFLKSGYKIFGPTQNAAMLETSKVFAKDFMKRYNIPTANYECFEIDQKQNAIDSLYKNKFPLVIKVDGLAAGKGVVICENMNDAKNVISLIFESKVFGNAGNNIVIEEFLSGNEASVFAISDGSDYVVLPTAQDHKKILDGENGKNTGGMGSFAPADKFVNTQILEKIKTRIIEPVLKGMKNEGYEYRGCLYCGLMIDESGNPSVIEFNVRFGDPETQVVLPLIKSNFLELLESSVNGTIGTYNLEIYNDHYCSVVLASKGYPDKYETGKVITGLEISSDDCLIFHAGTTINSENEIISNGGRVLNVVGKSSTSLKQAIEKAYVNVDKIQFENKYFRTDIGIKGVSI